MPDVAWLYVPKGFSKWKTSREGRADESKAEKNAARGAEKAPHTTGSGVSPASRHPRLLKPRALWAAGTWSHVRRLPGPIAAWLSGNESPARLP